MYDFFSPKGRGTVLSCVHTIVVQECICNAIMILFFKRKKKKTRPKDHDEVIESLAKALVVI